MIQQLVITGKKSSRQAERAARDLRGVGRR